MVKETIQYKPTTYKTCLTFQWGITTTRQPTNSKPIGSFNPQTPRTRSFTATQHTSIGSGLAKMITKLTLNGHKRANGISESQMIVKS